MATYKPVLYGYKKQDGTSQIAIRISKFRNSAKLPIGYYIKNKEWDPKGAVKSSNSLFVKYNMAIAAVIKELQEIEIAADMEGSMLNAFEIRQYYQNKRLRQVLILYEDWIENSKGKEISKITYRKSLEHFKTFLGTNTSLLVQNVTHDLVEKYEKYILSKARKGTGQGTANLLLYRLSSVMKSAVVRGIIPISKNPFEQYRFATHKTTSVFLPIEDIVKLASVPLKNKQDLYRHVFIAAFLAGGMRIRDILSIVKSNIKGDFERLEYTMSKNGKMKSIPICPALKDILARWVSNDREYVFPILNPRASSVHDEVVRKTALINPALKAIARKIEINEKISTHAARHSFGKIAENNTKDIKGLQEVYAHSNIETTLNYIEDNLDLDKYDYIIQSVQQNYSNVDKLLSNEIVHTT